MFERKVSSELPLGQVLVEVKAVSLNYRDLLVARRDYGGQFEPPIIVGSDMSDVVVMTANDIVRHKVHRQGCWGLTGTSCHSNPVYRA